MKQLLIIAVALAAVNANASRARVMALGNSAHLVDTQTVYTNPADIFALPSDYLNMETGATQGALAATTSGANSEGMIVKSYGSSKFGLSLGHQSQNASSWGLRSQAATVALRGVNQQNPLELSYGSKMDDMSWAATLIYSNYNDKKAAGATIEKENSMGVRFGVRASNWDASLRLGLANMVKDANGNELKGTSAIGLSAGYQMDSMYLFGGYSTAGIKETNNAGTDTAKFDTNTINLGVLNSTKKDGTDLFYSVQLVQTTNKLDLVSTEQKTLALPVLIGLEHAANGWLTLRGSVSQSTIINDSETKTSGTTVAQTSPGLNTTTVALGAGLQIGKVTFDGTLSTATTQTVNTTNLLAQAGLTYWF